MAADRVNRKREVRNVLIITMIANFAVLVAKAIAGFSADALSVLADAAHSSVDTWNNVMGLVLVNVAAKAPDPEHPYGHAKFETLGALAIVAFLSVTVYELTTSAIGRLLGRGSIVELDQTPLAIAVMLGSAVVNFVVARYETRRGQELHSELLIADAAHTRTDIYASLGVVVGLLLVRLGFRNADAIFTLLVAIVIARASWRILKTTIPILVDTRAVEADEICAIALSVEGVRDCFDVRSRGRTGEVFAELTITVDAHLNVEQAHVIADDVERRVGRGVGAREVVVHVEPQS